MSTCSRRKSATFIVYTYFAFIVTISTAQNVKNAYTQNFNPQQLLQDVPPQLLLKIANLFTSSNQNDITSRAGELLVSGLDVAVANSKFNVSSTCLNHTEIFLEALLGGEQWALRMVDALGKPPSAILQANLAWLGSYDECMSVQAVVNKNGTPTTYPYTGQYCKASFSAAQLLGQISPIPAIPGLNLIIGICFPSSCSPADGVALTNTLLSLIPGVKATTLPTPSVTCQKKSLELDTKAIVVIVVCYVFATVMVCGTAYDIAIRLLAKQHSKRYRVQPNDVAYGSSTKSPMENGNSVHMDKVDLNNVVGKQVVENGATPYIPKDDTDTYKYKPGVLGKVLLAFSMYTNASKILATSQPSGTLTAVNGIRFLSMSWVILGHSFSFVVPEIDNIITYYPAMMKRITFDAIRNATFSVDSFFVLSGLLVSYLSLKEMKKRGGALKFKWGLYYFHRIWRLTPPYMLVLMVYVPLMKHWGNGPLWNQDGPEIDECRDTWWWNILYINNLIEPLKECMAWTWYLANDMQFFVISPLMIIPLYYSSILGSISCMAFALTAFISTGMLSAHWEFAPDLTAPSAHQNEFFGAIYVKPWCRVGPYAVGIFVGYLLYKTDCKVKMPKIANAIGWLIATAVALSILYGLHSNDGSTIREFSVGVSALYNATSRTAWGACVAWVIFACATGYGGPVNTLLSWSPFVPLGRLTYCAYLVHILVLTAYTGSRHSYLYLYDLQIIYIFLGTICVSYAAAFVTSLAFESPMMGLEKVLLGREKNS